MKHSLDHSTATEANGIIWELCSRCEAWVSQHDHRLPCDAPDAQSLDLEDAYKSLFGQNQQLADEIQWLRTVLPLKLEQLDEGLRRKIELGPGLGWPQYLMFFCYTTAVMGFGYFLRL